MINLLSSKSINRLHNIISYEGSATINTKLNRTYPKNQAIISDYCMNSKSATSSRDLIQFHKFRNSPEISFTFITCSNRINK